MLFIINIILGIGLLVAGRKLFWLFVAAAGFFAGVQLTGRFWQGPEWLSVVIGIVLGILFAVLAMLLKSIAISLAGFFLGGSALTALAAVFGFEPGTFVLYLIGGILGILFISAFFDWALIAISSFAGASIITQTLDLNRPFAGVALILLLGAGILIQFSDRRREKKKDA